MSTNFDNQNNKLFGNFIKSFCFLGFGLSIAAFLLFNGTKLIIGDNPYRTVIKLSMLYKTIRFREIDLHPLPYLLSIVLISSIAGALWTAFIAPEHGKYIKLQILSLPWICVIITSPIWGLIWSISLRSPQDFIEQNPHDPKAVMWLFYKTDAISGLTTGWLSAIQSFPINILSYVVFCILLILSKNLFSIKGKNQNNVLVDVKPT
jgi:hypothetical protein